ncbi:MAG TPA: methylmalonyl-CoA carboxyltransferase [Candidatus Atribacteria bacterium]|nr:methylmalonyl-CoA carboxyltransferase [Candidatus Atribacteria bacterium]
MTIKEKIDFFRKRREDAKLGGGLVRIEKQHKIGKFTARERLGILLDVGSFVELGMFVTSQTASFTKKEEKFYGDGVVTGSGLIDGRKVFVYAQDFTVMGGSLGEEHAKKICLVMDQAIKTGAPIIGLIDSGGARIQEGLGYYGSIFYQNTLAAGVVPQISIILGPCAGGAVYSPALSDFVFMVEGISRMHITGPEVVKAITGEEVTPEELGGAQVHYTRSGVAHFVSTGEKECMNLVKELLSYLPSNNREFPPCKSVNDPAGRMEEDLEHLIPEDPKDFYDMKNLISLIVDNGIFLEVQEGFAENIIIGFSRLNGYTIGIVANQPLVYAGCLDIDASDKAARFIRFCDAFQIPIINFVDCPGYLPGTQQEYSGIIRHGAKMLYAYCEATVPRISIVTRKVYGGAMSGMGVSKLVGTDLTVILPITEMGLMGPEGGVNVLYKEEIEKAENPEKMREEKIRLYREQFANPYRAAEKGWVDAIIEPKEIRPFLISSLERLRGKEEIRPKKKHGTIPL